MPWTNLVSTVVQDARYALRWFRRDFALTCAIVMTLGFGIGVNTGVFSILSGMVFRSRIETDARSFFQVLASPLSAPETPPRLFSSSVADFAAYRSSPGVKLAAAWSVSSARLDEDTDPTLLLLASCDFFELYGLEKPKSGRVFTPSECEAASRAPYSPSTTTSPRRDRAGVNSEALAAK